MPTPDPLLILGGTAEARALAAALVGWGPVISSLAGRVADPSLPVGDVRIGGFGGASGLADYLGSYRVRAVVDATHPYAQTISASAGQACSIVGVPLLRLVRPGWRDHPLAGGWRWVRGYAEAARAAADIDGTVFLTTGRQSLPHLLSVSGLSETPCLVRVVDPPDVLLPSAWEVIRSRGPYTVEGERRLMTSRGVRVLVTKDSGGAMTQAKLTAAAELGVEVVIISRPPPSDATDSVEIVSIVDDAVGWVLQQVRSSPRT